MANEMSQDLGLNIIDLEGIRLGVGGDEAMRIVTSEK